MRLERDDARALEAAVARAAARAKQPLSFDGLLNRWTEFVAAVERGYQESIYEYANDLSTRSLLDEITREVSESARLEIAASLEATDRRFYEATREVEKAICPATAKGERPWCYRVPNRLLGELKEDLRAEGIEPQ